MDRTSIAATRQLDAMDVHQVEIGVLDPDRETMRLREWDRPTLEKSIPWLKRQNAAGSHVYVRPLGSQGISLVDDLSISALQRMEQDGTLAACIVETSPQNYQAWIRVSSTPIAAPLATAVGKVLARRYDADRNSIDWRHFGRLAGFTNCKPAYVDDLGRYPFVLLRHAKAKVTPNAGDLLAAAQKILEEEVREKTPVLAASNTIGLEQLQDFYRSELHGLMSRYGRDTNYSKVDWMIAGKLLQRGVPRDSVAELLRTTSPGLFTRKKGHVEDYIRRTLDKLQEG
jgi:hypothetical protein